MFLSMDGDGRLCKATFVVSASLFITIVYSLSDGVSHFSHQNANYDDLTKKRRFRRNNTSHNYPQNRKLSQPHPEATLSIETLVSQLKVMSEAVTQLQQKLAEQETKGHSASDDEASSSGTNDIVTPGIITKAVAPISLRALMAKTKEVPKKKKPKKQDENWSSDSSAERKKKISPPRKKKKKYYSSSSDSHDTSDDEEDNVRPAKKRFTGTKKTVKQMRKQFASGRAVAAKEVDETCKTTTLPTPITKVMEKVAGVRCNIVSESVTPLELPESPGHRLKRQVVRSPTVSPTKLPPSAVEMSLVQKK